MSDWKYLVVTHECPQGFPFKSLDSVQRFCVLNDIPFTEIQEYPRDRFP